MPKANLKVPYWSLTALMDIEAALSLEDRQRVSDRLKVLLDTLEDRGKLGAPRALAPMDSYYGRRRSCLLIALQAGGHMPDQTKSSVDVGAAEYEDILRAQDMFHG